MPNAEFRVGSEERHTILVKVSTISGHVKVLVDGKEVPLAEITSSGFVVDFGWPSMKFAVGERERHLIELKILTRLPPVIELYADGLQERPV